MTNPITQRSGSPQPDWCGVTLNAGGIGKLRDGLTLDLCGIGKGRALDRAVVLLRDAELLSVSVVAADAMTADGWATALFAAGPVTGVTLARDHGIDALFLLRAGADIAQITTASMNTMLL